MNIQVIHEIEGILCVAHIIDSNLPARLHAYATTYCGTIHADTNAIKDMSFATLCDLIAHEMRHVYQEEKGGWRWYLTYLIRLISIGYRSEPDELDAIAYATTNSEQYQGDALKVANFLQIVYPNA